MKKPSDVWAVGRRSGLTTLPLVEHWDGRRWRLVRAPGRRGRGEYFHGAAAVSGHKVWAVGSLYPKYDIERRTLAGRWNGRSWSLMPTPNRRSLDNDLLAVDAVPGGGVWAVGMTSFVEATRRPIVQRWDGRRWRNGRMPPVRTGGLQGLDLLSRTDGWAVGAELYVDGDRGGYRPLTERLGRC